MTNALLCEIIHIETVEKGQTLMASNLRSVMTWKQAVEQFKDHVLPSVVATEKLYGRGPDLPMRRETWNNWTDSLCKNEQISDWQYNNWSQPECCEG